MNKSLPSTNPPRSSSTTFPLVNRIITKGWIDLPEAYGGHGAPGRFLEDLLDVAENNLDSPDLMDWEVKFHGGKSLLTLFHKDPEPKGIINEMVNQHGWLDEKGRISFRHTISGETNRGFYVVNEDKRITIKHRDSNVVEPYWNHNTLLNAAGSKLRRLILIHGQTATNPRRVRYDSAIAYWDFNLLGFCEAAEKGLVYIDFDARTSKGPGTALRNHGTKFRVQAKNIDFLYEYHAVINSGSL